MEDQRMRSTTIMADQPIEITEVNVRLLDDPSGSLIGWASCIVNGCLFLNGIQIRESAEGSTFLTFPCQISAQDKRHFFFNPINRNAHRAVEEAILDRMPGGNV
jgi:DNA-binding cell septation regulator SpoVG